MLLLWIAFRFMQSSTRAGGESSLTHASGGNKKRFPAGFYFSSAVRKYTIVNMNHLRTLGLLTCFMALTAASCQSKGPSSGSDQPPLMRGNGGVYTADDAGQTISASAGERFDLVLPSNPTTGYRWKMAQSPDGEVVRLYRNDYTSESPGTIGGGGHETWTFRAVSPGSTALTMQYVAPDGRRVAKELTFHLIVH
jgi:inhibitor of cysteine peptidase